MKRFRKDDLKMGLSCQLDSMGLTNTPTDSAIYSLRAAGSLLAYLLRNLMNGIANKDGLEDREFVLELPGKLLVQQKRGLRDLLSRIGEPDDQALDTKLVLRIPAIGRGE
jgi:hypothetical protein